MTMKIKQTMMATLLALASIVAPAQTVPGTATISWTLPTVSVEGLPLTGINSLTEVRVFLATAQIADDSAMAPTLTLGPGATTTTHTMQVANGSTLYARIKACNAGGCSAFSSQASKLIQVDTTPGVPTDVTIELQVSPGG
jgi:hypothetical protein